jgi:hypothetical protein
MHFPVATVKQVQLLLEKALDLEISSENFRDCHRQIDHF